MGSGGGEQFPLGPIGWKEDWPCSWFQDKDKEIIKLWITNSLHYLKKNLGSSLFVEEAKELKVVVSELERLML